MSIAIWYPWFSVKESNYNLTKRERGGNEAHHQS